MELNISDIGYFASGFSMGVVAGVGFIRYIYKAKGIRYKLKQKALKSKIVSLQAQIKDINQSDKNTNTRLQNEIMDLHNANAMLVDKMENLIVEYEKTLDGKNREIQTLQYKLYHQVK